MIFKCYVAEVEYILDYGVWCIKANNKLQETNINPLLLDGVVYDIDNDMEPAIKLSSKELEQFKYHLNARSYYDISMLMDVSLPTVKRRASIIIEKFNYLAKTIHELVIIYYKHQLLLAKSSK